MLKTLDYGDRCLLILIRDDRFVLGDEGAIAGC
jgi:hypothetical protein